MMMTVDISGEYWQVLLLMMASDGHDDDNAWYMVEV